MPAMIPTEGGGARPALWRHGMNDPAVKPLWGAGLDEAHPLARDLTWFYAINEESGGMLSDLTGRSDAALSGPLWTANTRGPCLRYSNAADIAMTSFCPFTPTGFSLVCRFRTNGANQTHTLLRAAGGAAQGYSADTDVLLTVNHASLTSSAANHLLIGGLNPAGSTFLFVAGNTPVNDGLWHTAVGVRDGGMARLYVDGVLDAQGALGAIQASASMAWAIGRYPPSAVDSFAGNVEFAALYNRALTDEDAAQLSASPYALMQSQAARRPISPAVLQALLTETLALSEDRRAALARALNEALVLLDGRGLWAGRLLTEPLGLAETLARALNGSGQSLLKTLTEAVMLGDARASLPAKPLVDGLPFGDTRVLALARRIGEILGYTDNAQALNAGMAVLTIVTTSAHGDGLNRGGGKA